MHLLNTRQSARMRGARTIAFTFAAAAALIMTAGCETLNGQPINLLSTQQEVQLGRELAEQIEGQETILDDPAVQSYVREIGARLARHAHRQDVEYRFTVIDAPDTVNAFALPGGHMYIYTGLMKLCRNEAELAGVMAHEIGHVAARHHGEGITRMYGYSLVMRALLGEEPGAVAQMASQFLGAAGHAYFSRGNEREADQIAAEILWRAGYNPDALAGFMQQLQNYEAQRGGAANIPLFATHPPTAERMHLIRQYVTRFPPDQRAQRPVYEDRYREQALDRL